MTLTTLPHDAQLGPHSRPSAYLTLIHASIFLLSVAAGALLIYSLQPPPPPPGSLLYEIHFFTSDKPADHSTEQLAAIQQTTPATSSWRGADLVGMHQFSTEPEERLRFTMATPTYLAEFRNFAPLRFEVRGAPRGDRIRTHLKIGVNGIDASHHFELDGAECRVVEFMYGEKQHRRWCYAIIQVQPTKPIPSVGAALSGPKTAASKEE